MPTSEEVMYFAELSQHKCVGYFNIVQTFLCNIEWQKLVEALDVKNGGLCGVEY